MKVKTKVKAGWCDRTCKKDCRDRYYRCGSAQHCVNKYENCLSRCGCG